MAESTVRSLSSKGQEGHPAVCMHDACMHLFGVSLLPSFQSRKNQDRRVFLSPPASSTSLPLSGLESLSFFPFLPRCPSLVLHNPVLDLPIRPQVLSPRQTNLQLVSNKEGRLGFMEKRIGWQGQGNLFLESLESFSHSFDRFSLVETFISRCRVVINAFLPFFSECHPP